MIARPMRSRLIVVVTSVLLMLLAACSTPPIFAQGAVADYQLGGAYEPAAEVSIVVRDAGEQPVNGIYSICYINGFQSQPGESWPTKLLLRDAADAAVIDSNWPDETLLDIRSADNRVAIAERFRPLVARCADKGFDAVEFDNLDSYTRSGGLLDREDAIAMATLLVKAGHEVGLAVAQKNSAGLLGQAASDIGFDFVIVEECDQFSECADFTDAYGDAVINIEYTDDLRRPFAEVCADVATPLITMLRDRNLTPPGSPDYVFERC
ncbi:endo alpha-1,4 polygalactosaminidase [Salinibacterium sp. TMP30]|uniref:endo alpha-1,4 polygalactosaminidase n=1 Tax=Salinibacterium sp. TMP30 TaxID=3138237 RepID=UPI003139A519